MAEHVEKDLARIDWDDRELVGEQFLRCRFDDASLREVVTRNCVFEDCDFSGVRLSSSTHVRTAFLGCRFRRTELFNATLEECKLTGSSFLDCSLRPMSVLGGDWSYVGLRGADLRKADLRRLRLREADLGDADLRKADLRDCDLGHARLDHAQLAGADLRGADSPGSTCAASTSPASASTCPRPWRSRRRTEPGSTDLPDCLPVTALILDGKATAAQIRAGLLERVADLEAAGRTPGLGTVLVGDDAGSRAYVAGKHRDCAEIGMVGIARVLPADANQADVAAVVAELNADPACTGYLVQLPLPRGLDGTALLEQMDPAKDADGLHPVNLGRLVLGMPGPLPCTPRGVVELLRRYEVPIAGADVVIVGRGVTAGRGLGLLLSRRTENATVTLCHTGTRDLSAHLRRADIIVAAAGSPGLVKPGDIKPGAAVLDVGISRTAQGRLVGDVDPDVADVAGYLAPMPGGVGPMTRAMLMVNVVEAAERAAAGGRAAG